MRSPDLKSAQTRSQADICLLARSPCCRVPFAVCSRTFFVSCSRPSPDSLSPLLPHFLLFLFLCFSTASSASVTMQRASLGRASVFIATVKATTPRSGPRLRLEATPLVPCALCIPAKPHFPLSRSGTDIKAEKIWL